MINTTQDDMEVTLHINPLLGTLELSIYQDGMLMANIDIPRSRVDVLIRQLYPKAILSEQELTDMMQRAWQFFR